MCFNLETRSSHFSTDEEKIRKRHPGFGLSLETKLKRVVKKLIVTLALRVDKSGGGDVKEAVMTSILLQVNKTMVNAVVIHHVDLGWELILSQCILMLMLMLMLIWNL